MRTIDVEEFKQELSKASVWTTLSISEIMDSIAFDAIRCADGYLYCKKRKMLVDESCFCSWGRRE